MCSNQINTGSHQPEQVDDFPTLVSNIDLRSNEQEGSAIVDMSAVMSECVAH